MKDMQWINIEIKETAETSTLLQSSICLRNLFNRINLIRVKDC